MNKFLEDFKSTKVLNTEDFLRIKKYIDNKFSSLDNKPKADILCTTIHQILDKFIIGEDSDLDSKVKQEVLRTNIFGGQPTTYLYDVLITYLKQCDFNKSNTIERLISWIKKYSKTSINEESFITFLYEERYINETQREKLVQELVIVQDKSEIVKRENHKDNLTFKDVEEKHQNDEIAVTTIKKQNLIESKTIINKNNKKKHYRVTVIGIIVILIPSLYLGVKLKNRKNINEISLINNEEAKEVSTILGSKLKGKTFNPNVPEYMKYKEIDKEKLRGYLKTRNSLLLEEPYFSSIICSAKEFNLNPIVLFSITGQEQGFVPKDQTEAKKIANNPFNVFHSWQEYNTDIKDSSEIAARTVFNICREMPKDENVFKWINNTYAEDKNWHKGVESFFKLLN
ncbi:hypothetical protein [Hathewaya limosa]|uniref:Mannosyl-glycoprotein endo-beta-N-acetylglucosaminidase n=1 Tax=Hathewaya limosa TaxID=1536 RepID=A0ABU0JTT8_HATLI|nr:hypothetical protein [Hathewaya limosa]MDQ0480513.1 hypothetical protein [Hathewaya limosa]